MQQIVNCIQRAVFLSLLLTVVHSFGQQVSSTATEEPNDAAKKERSSTSWLIYGRVIRDPQGNTRFDENIVPTFRICNSLFVEPGIRFGETGHKFDSYVHYKLELRTKFFWHAVRFFARVSDNVISYTSPQYRRTNYLAVVEGKWPLSKSFTFGAAIGNVYARQVNNSIEGWPALSSGARNSYWIYKASVRYHLNESSSIETAIGSYDVFNPYLPASPFLQASFECDISQTTALYSYFRYQFNQSINVPANDFLGIGVRLHLVKHR